MKSFFSVQRTRYTAAVMLFVWLMSLSVGVANACLLQQDRGPREYFSQGQAAPAHVTTNTLNFDDYISSPEKITCLHFCVAEQSTLITDHLDGVAPLDLVPILFLTGLPVPTTEQPFPTQSFIRPSGSEPPVSIRYLRLTI